MSRELLSPTHFQPDSESLHLFAVHLLRIAQSSPLGLALIRILANNLFHPDPKLETQVAGIRFASPVMVGAGWDKNGLAVRGLHSAGFSAVEVGTGLHFPQSGHPKPRQFVLAPGVVINHLGFPSPGVEEVEKNLSRYRGSGIPIGISLGLNRDFSPESAPQTFSRLAEILDSHAAYFAINTSSPNTVRLSKLNTRDHLSSIIQALKAKTGKPVFIKVSPDLYPSQLDEIIRVCLDQKIAGIIATNTTADLRIKSRYGGKWKDVPGGLSGSDPGFRQLSTATIAYIHRQTQDTGLEIIGVGGIDSPGAALEKIAAGAKLVQVVTAIRTKGLSLPSFINKGILAYLDTNHIAHISGLAGSRS